ncbi:hypothetical protein SESBI_39849 [Sesbania bispinosa]|nr:hypothetical protein SESBI_39849 [Sesbania bispinosa]
MGLSPLKRLLLTEESQLKPNVQYVKLWIRTSSIVCGTASRRKIFGFTLVWILVQLLFWGKSIYHRVGSRLDIPGGSPQHYLARAYHGISTMLGT